MSRLTRRLQCRVRGLQSLFPLLLVVIASLAPLSTAQVLHSGGIPPSFSLSFLSFLSFSFKFLLFLLNINFVRSTTLGTSLLIPSPSPPSPSPPLFPSPPPTLPLLSPHLLDRTAVVAFCKSLSLTSYFNISSCDDL